MITELYQGYKEDDELERSIKCDIIQTLDVSKEDTRHCPLGYHY